MADAATTNVLYVLVNGGPNEWAMARDVPRTAEVDGVMAVRFDDVPDELADQIEQSGNVGGFWDELCEGPHTSI